MAAEAYPRHPTIAPSRRALAPSTLQASPGLRAPLLLGNPRGEIVAGSIKDTVAPPRVRLLRREYAPSATHASRREARQQTLLGRSGGSPSRLPRNQARIPLRALRNSRGRQGRRSAPRPQRQGAQFSRTDDPPRTTLPPFFAQSNWRIIRQLMQPLRGSRALRAPLQFSVETIPL